MIYLEKIRYTDGKLKVWYLGHTLKTWKRLGIWDLKEGGGGAGIVKYCLYLWKNPAYTPGNKKRLSV